MVAQPWYPQKAANIAVKIALMVTGVAAGVLKLKLLAITALSLASPKNTIRKMPVNTSANIALLSKALVFIFFEIEDI